MARQLRIVIVSYVDDNFGDNLIRISFQGLLEVALANHGLTSDEYEIIPMSLKHVDEQLMETSDAIFFAGGGLFGLSYLGFFEHVDRITATAERCGIPVLFSSMGVNNMSAEDGSVQAIAEIVGRSCVKAIAVRENLPLFERVVAGLEIQTRQVADPAVWTKYVYGMTDVVPNGTLGINVVRGGLFAANQRKWGLGQELKYLTGLLDLADSAGIDSQLYTNGSLDDNNTLRYFAEKHAVAPEQIVLPQTTREVVEAIASRSFIASIRMHSSIISYSFGIPTIALEWNDKLPFFYKAIGCPNRVIPFGEWTAQRAFETLRSAGSAPEHPSNYQDYLMSTYDYIHEVVGSHVLKDATTSAAYGFSEVAEALVKRAHEVDEDEFDLRHKMGKVERAYLRRFVTIRENKTNIDALNAQVAALSAEIQDLRDENSTLSGKVQSQQRELELRFTTRLMRFARRMRRKLFSPRARNR